MVSLEEEYCAEMVKLTENLRNKLKLLHCLFFKGDRKSSKKTFLLIEK